LEEGAVVAFASDPLLLVLPGVAAPLASDPLPFFPGADVCAGLSLGGFVLLFAWSLDCASARFGRTAKIIVDAKTLGFIGVSSETSGFTAFLPVEHWSRSV
jgi:hypothetical protein